MTDRPKLFLSGRLAHAGAAGSDHGPHVGVSHVEVDDHDELDLELSQFFPTSEEQIVRELRAVAALKLGANPVDGKWLPFTVDVPYLTAGGRMRTWAVFDSGRRHFVPGEAPAPTQQAEGEVESLTLVSEHPLVLRVKLGTSPTASRLVRSLQDPAI